MSTNSDAACVNPSLQSPLNVSSKDKFILVLNLPPVLRNSQPPDPDLNIEKLHISIFGTVVPTSVVPPIDVRWGGQSVKYSSYSRPEFSSLNVSFIVDNSYQNYYILWKWLSVLNDPTNSFYAGSNEKALSIQTEYQTTFSLLALNEYNQPTMEFKFHHAFLTGIGAINYSYKDGEILESSAEFQFGQLTLHKIKNLTN
jgi:hypothetical protein